MIKSTYCRRLQLSMLCLLFTIIFFGSSSAQTSATPAKEAISGVQLEIRPAHLWLPPFALDRVGKSKEAIVRCNTPLPEGSSLQLTTYFRNRQVERKMLAGPDSTPFTFREVIGEADLAVLELVRSGQTTGEIARKSISLPAFEFDGIARPDSVVNPVDLGTILVPADWLLLTAGQKATLSLAGVTHEVKDQPVHAKAWYASNPKKIFSSKMSLKPGVPVRNALSLAAYTGSAEKDVLHVSVEAKGGRELWHKTINVMVMPRPDKAPLFGAVSTKLRYDAGVLNIVNGKREHYDYYKAWKPELEDVVVFLPNGSRWVFWRGASYIPIWASRFNTGLSYEWAERISPNEGFRDCPEPLMDKELRYGTVQIIESTAARVHVRWNYQSCDFNYKVNGDFAHEDYYFYPDGIGTRALTLTSIPEAEYEVAEFILLASQAAIPMQVLPSDPMNIISLKTGKSAVISLPEKDKSWRQLPDPLIYRMRIHQQEPMSAFSFNPNLFVKPMAFKPFLDSGVVVTPAYWGGHWPLSQGFNTAYKIDESLWSAPSHNSLVTWAANRPKPIKSEQMQSKDALGQQKTMRTDVWAWLIGMTEAPDEELLRMCKSFAQPPVLELKGAKAGTPVYSQERRAFSVAVEKNEVSIRISPSEWCVNPVFELQGAPEHVKEVKLDGQVLKSEQFAWDKKTLWVKATFSKPAQLELSFAE